MAVATEDHKPYNDSERERIEKAGGCVSMKRVDGDLAVVSEVKSLLYVLYSTVLYCIVCVYMATSRIERSVFSS